MSLPKPRDETYSAVLPVAGIEVRHRAFKTKEERWLLRAREQESEGAMMDAVVNIISNCVLEPEDLDPMDLPVVDLGWMFLRLRAVSVSNVVRLTRRMPDGRTAEV